jgi:hypothetical protein
MTIFYRGRNAGEDRRQAERFGFCIVTPRSFGSDYPAHHLFLLPRLEIDGSTVFDWEIERKTADQAQPR